MNKKEILELYIQDLESKVPESDARNNRIEMLRNELKQVKNNDLLPVVNNNLGSDSSDGVTVCGHLFSILAKNNWGFLIECDKCGERYIVN